MHAQMKPRSAGCLLLAAGILLSFPLSGHADEKADVRAALTARYRQSNAALARKDTAGVLAIFAEDYSRLNAQGEVTIAGMPALKEQLLKVERASKKLTQTTRIQSLTVKGNEATVIVQQTYARDGRTSSGPLRDFWQKIKGRWMLKRSRRIESDN